MFLKKGTLLAPSGPTSHLFIICNDTCRLGANLLVNISSFYDGCDDTCVLNVGDHDFVTHASYVFYAEATIMKAAGIKNGFDRGVLTPRDPLIDPVFERVIEGINKSPDTPRNVVKYFNQL